MDGQPIVRYPSSGPLQNPSRLRLGKISELIRQDEREPIRGMT